MSRSSKWTLEQELAWALHLATKDVLREKGWKWGYGSTVMKALRRYKKEGKRPYLFDQPQPMKPS